MQSLTRSVYIYTYIHISASYKKASRNVHFLSQLIYYTLHSKPYKDLFLSHFKNAPSESLAYEERNLINTCLVNVVVLYSRVHLYNALVYAYSDSFIAYSLV